MYVCTCVYMYAQAYVRSVRYFNAYVHLVYPLISQDFGLREVSSVFLYHILGRKQPFFEVICTGSMG